jgi:asparagine synthetase A
VLACWLKIKDSGVEDSLEGDREEAAARVQVRDNETTVQVVVSNGNWKKESQNMTGTEFRGCGDSFGLEDGKEGRA